MKFDMAVYLLQYRLNNDYIVLYNYININIHHEYLNIVFVLFAIKANQPSIVVLKWRLI